ncbi:hypothetical protein S83_066954, partial [Arachis hypogaea]
LSLDQIAIILSSFCKLGCCFFLKFVQVSYIPVHIDIHATEIGKIFQLHSLLMSSFTIKKSSSFLNSLNAGKKRLCKL